MTVQERPKVPREPRRQMNGRLASLVRDDDATRYECRVHDVAPGGARITTAASMDVGERFSLALVATHDRRQRCEVVWRREQAFGIKFLT